MIVLDTNVISELEGRLHRERLLAWLDGFQIETLFLTTIAVAEIRFGLAMLPEGKRRTQLASTFDRIEAQFEGRILGNSLVQRIGTGLSAQSRNSKDISWKPRTP